MTVFDLPEKYSSRMVDLMCGVRVYGDRLKTIALGVVPTQSDAMALLDGYDKQLTRRIVLAEQLLEENRKNENEIADQLKRPT